MTQSQTIIEHLKSHGSITQREANTLGIGRLAARISELRKQHDIISIPTTVKTKFGKTTIAVYKIAS